MKAQAFAIVALCARVGLAIALPEHAHNLGAPHGHQKYHEKRDAATVLVTETDIVTVTNSEAVVIVNQQNEVIRTDYKGHHTAPVFPIPAAVQTTPTSVAIPVGPLSTYSDHVSPSEMRMEPSTSTDDVSSASITATLSTQASSSASIAATPSALPVSVIANSGHKASGLGGFSIDYDVSTGSQGGATTCRDFNSDFAFLKGQGAGLIRTYGAGCMTEVVNAAAAKGVRLMVGIIDISDDINSIITKIQASTAGWGPIDTVYIGNEVVSRGGSAAAVAAAVSAARGTLSAGGFNGNVITVDTFGSFNDPVLCSTSTFCGMNAHAFFSGVSADQAGSFLRSAFNQVVNANGGKHTVVTETGWPYKGSANGNAVPSPDNQRTAMDSIMAEFGGSAGDVYLFQAYDASYKQSGAYGVEPYFGLFESDSGGV